MKLNLKVYYYITLSRQYTKSYSEVIYNNVIVYYCSFQVD